MHEHICVCIYVNVCMNPQICVCASLYIHAYMDIHTFTYRPTIKLAEFTMVPEVHMRIVTECFAFPFPPRVRSFSIINHFLPYNKGSIYTVRIAARVM